MGERELKALRELIDEVRALRHIAYGAGLLVADRDSAKMQKVIDIWRLEE